MPAIVIPAFVPVEKKSQYKFGRGPSHARAKDDHLGRLCIIEAVRRALDVRHVPIYTVGAR